METHRSGKERRDHKACDRYLKMQNSVRKTGHIKIKSQCVCRLSRIQERVKVIIMTITIAGNKKEYEEGVTVETLIEKENVENPLYVTVTINDDFVGQQLLVPGYCRCNRTEYRISEEQPRAVCCYRIRRWRIQDGLQ